MKDLPKPHRRNWTLRLIVVLFLVLTLGFLGWSCWVYVQIEDYAGLDQAAPSDAIARSGRGGVRWTALPGFPRTP